MSDHTRAPRACSTNRLAELAEVLVGALMPTDGEPHAWLVRAGRPSGANHRAAGANHRAAGSDDLGGRRAHESCGATSGSPVGLAPPPVDDIGLLPLDSITDSPLEVLLGLDAPDDWWALGLVATGQARRVDRPGQPTTDVLVVLLVDRTGRTASLVPRLDGTGSYEALEVTAGPEGVLLDLCRRAFGLPTAPPDQPPMAWWAQLWLDAILREAAIEPERAWTWPELMALHPLCDLLGTAPEPGEADVAHGAGDGAELDPDRFARAIEVVVAGYDWERLRRAGLAGPGRDITAWMDEGCFARWTLGLHPEAPDLLAALQALLPPEASGPISGVLDRWGVVT
jgi:hypothetical protein